MAQITFSDDHKAGFRALRAARATLAATHPANARAEYGTDVAEFGEYTIPAPADFVILNTALTGEDGVPGEIVAATHDYALLDTATGIVTTYADLSALQTAVAAL